MINDLKNFVSDLNEDELVYLIYKRYLHSNYSNKHLLESTPPKLLTY